MATKQQADNYGTFEKDGEARVATSNAEAVQLRFTGWAEKDKKAEASRSDSKS